MTMENLGWKVLRVDPDTGVRTSTFAITGALEYPRGQRRTPRPGCGPITLFGNYVQAEYFARLVGYGLFEIVPVKYETWDVDTDIPYSLWQPAKGESVRGPKLSRYVSEKDAVTLDRVLTGVRRKLDLPKGTVLASAVTCLE